MIVNRSSNPYYKLAINNNLYKKKKIGRWSLAPAGKWFLRSKKKYFIKYILLDTYLNSKCIKNLMGELVYGNWQIKALKT